MSKEQERLDRHHKACREAEHSIWGRAIASAGWEWDSFPYYSHQKGDKVERCRVILWHATTGRMIYTVLAEDFLGQELLHAILGQVDSEFEIDEPTGKLQHHI